MKSEWTRRLIVRCVCCCLLLPAPASVAAQQLTPIDSSELRGLRYRMIGPSRGGRVTTVTGVPQEPLTFYMGSTGGGVWKTTNAGINWTNVSDGFFASASMGSIDVADSDPNIIYAGTGSEALRSNVSIGPPKSHSIPLRRGHEC